MPDESLKSIQEIAIEIAARNERDADVAKLASCVVMLCERIARDPSAHLAADRHDSSANRGGETIPFGEDSDLEFECAECGESIGDEEAISTYCGSMHRQCLAEHKRKCGVCAADAWL